MIGSVTGGQTDKQEDRKMGDVLRHKRYRLDTQHTGRLITGEPHKDKYTSVDTFSTNWGNDAAELL